MGQRTNVRNVAIVGPSGVGKTTLLESLLFVAGAIGRKGSVADGTTVGDGSAEARERQMSTEVSVAALLHAGPRLHVLDCPGSVEFVARRLQRGAGLRRRAWSWSSRCWSG